MPKGDSTFATLPSVQLLFMRLHAAAASLHQVLEHADCPLPVLLSQNVLCAGAVCLSACMLW